MTDDTSPHPAPKTNGAALVAMAAYKQARRWVVLGLGASVIVVGVVMIVTPGPAVVVIPLGIGILATEFYWAKRWLVKFRQKYRVVKNSAMRKRNG